MENRIIDEDIVDGLPMEEAINTINFPGLDKHMGLLDEIITESEALADSVWQLLRGEIPVIQISPTMIYELNEKCRRFCDEVGQIVSYDGVIPIHLIRIVREIQTTAMLIARTPELFVENQAQELREIWGG